MKASPSNQGGSGTFSEKVIFATSLTLGVTLGPILLFIWRPIEMFTTLRFRQPPSYVQGRIDAGMRAHLPVT